MNKKLILVIMAAAIFLRLWNIDKVPVSLFGDEVDVGYQAYSILKTGRDYYGNFMPIHFHSLAEWRTPLYLYSAVPTVALFGVSPLGVRLPAAIFGIFGVLGLYLLVKELTKSLSAPASEKLALISALILTFSPWHIQYSRAGFEVTELLFFLLFGLYFFMKSLQNGKLLWLPMVCFGLMPWVYSTAKLFTPILLVFLCVLYHRDLRKLSRKYVIYSLVALFIVAAPITYGTVFGGGLQRFGYISVFTDPTTEPEVGSARQTDARVRGETGEGLQPTLVDKGLHNKFTFWGGNIIHNYLQAFSTDFLFIKGDPNLRHSIARMGEFYKVEAITLLFGAVVFFARSVGSGQNSKLKLFMLFWILAGVFPAAITRDGGNHATRLILVLPPLIFLIAYGIYELKNLANKKLAKGLMAVYFAVWVISFVFYQHNFWVHNPWESERWWHAGYRESIQSIKAVENDYEKIVISTANEPPWIFFAGWYQYDPAKWQKEFPIGNDVNLAGFGKVSHIDKFYFGSPLGGLYDWGKVIDSKTLYLASAKEVNVNLIMEPGRTPGDLKLIKSIAYPSGEPAYYLFARR